MKLLVFSDSHGDISNMLKVMDIHSDADVIVHLGDLVNDITDVSYVAETKKNVRYEYVAGNGDYYSRYDVTQKIIQIEQKKIFLTHGHLFKIRYVDFSLMYEKGKELNCDVFLFGHTHIPFMEERNGCLYLNPGSISLPRSSAGRTYATVDIINSGKINAAIHKL